MTERLHLGRESYAMGLRNGLKLELCAWFRVCRAWRNWSSWRLQEPPGDLQVAVRRRNRVAGLGVLMRWEKPFGVRCDIRVILGIWLGVV